MSLINSSLRLFALSLAVVFMLTERSTAAETALLHMTNEEDKDTTVFALSTDDATSDVKGFIKITYAQNGQVKAKTPYSIQNIAAGIVIEKRAGRDVVRLRSTNFEAHNGGNLILDTLFSGVNDTRKKYAFELERSGDDWKLLRDGKVIRSMHLKSNKVFLIGTVGIKDIITK